MAAAFFVALVILVGLWDTSLAFEESRKTRKISDSRRFELLTNRASKYCRSDADCFEGEYCHAFHRLCLRPYETVTVAPVKSALKKCSKDIDCKSKEYCHVFWKICLPSQDDKKKKPATKRPSGYCRSTKDCKATERCHKRLGTCFTKRMNGKDTATCKTDTDCGRNECCLANLGICMAYKLPGEMCLAEKTDFVCPCISESFCKTRRKWVSRRRIINKMKLPQTVARHLKTSNTKRRYRVGKCMLP